MKYKAIQEDGKIEDVQDIVKVSYTNFNGKYVTYEVNVKDEHTRKALIAIGWTPPKEEE